MFSCSSFNLKLSFFHEKFEKKNEEIKELKQKLNQQQETLTSLDQKIEDQINRSCRSTLVFTNVNEKQNESWDATTKILAGEIFRYCRLDNNSTTSVEAIQKDIDRAHRTGMKKENISRPITVKFSTWKAAQGIMSMIIRTNSKRDSPSHKIYVEQKYSSKLTERRNNAKVERKKLMQTDEYGSAKMYVCYPATLMVKNVGERKYSKLEEF